MRATTPFAILLTATLLGGCASMNKDDCLSADWYSQGREDGAGGESRDQYQRHREACAKHGIEPDKAAYQEGYEHGLDDFCTPANGYENGRQGYNYRGVCPAELEGGFLLGYQQGKALFEAEQRVAQYDSALQDHGSRINNAEYQIYRLQEILADRDSSDAERQQALANIRYLQRDIQLLRMQMHDLRYQRDDAAMQLMELNRQGVRGW